MTLEFLRYGLGHELTDYRRGWDLQRRIHAEVVAGQRPNTVILLEHASVYTAGKRTEDFERPTDGTPVVDVDRGGKITWHGPGQLVGYPIVRLPETVYVVDYVRRLEEAIIGLFTLYGLSTGRVPGRSGVWLPASPFPAPSTGSGHPSPELVEGSGHEGVERKIAAIGIRVAAGVTMHGFAINVDPDLGWFDKIVPCGILDAGVTSLTAETGARPTLTEVADQVEPQLQRYLAFTPYEQSAPLAENPPVTPGLAVGVS